MITIPEGLNFTSVRRRRGVLVDYDLVFSKNIVLSNFTLFDSFEQVEIKNIGQVSPPQVKSEVYILELLESKQSFDMCSEFFVTPISINGVPYNKDEPGIEIPFDDILLIAPSGRNSFILATTDPIKKQIPVIYKVAYTIQDLWTYIVTCEMPSV